MKPGFSRTAAILSAFVLGGLLPQAAAAAGIIRWLIITMLFIVFLRTRLSRNALSRSHGVLLAINIAMGFIGWGLGWLIGGTEVALAGFFCGITPTATAAPVIISFLNGRVDYVVAAFVLTNVVIAALLPALMPLVLGPGSSGAFSAVLGSVALVVFVPMALAWIVRTVHPRAVDWPPRLSNFSFGLWVLVLFFITANVSDFIRRQVDMPTGMLIQISALSAILCAANFGLGRVIGGKDFSREASQALGQKNTAFTIYLALSYAGPLAAFGPTCYVLWHNLWNSWQLHQHGHGPGRPAVAKT